MSSCIILGDVHLGKNSVISKSSLGLHTNSRVADQIDLLDWTLEQAIDRVANNIIITGDIFEEPKPHPSLIVLFISWLKKCQANNINVHIIVGNHDMLRIGTSITSSLDIISEIELEGISVYKNINTIFIGETAFTFMPFRDRKSFGSITNSEAISILRDSLVYELAAIPSTYKKIIVGHLAIEGSIPVGDEIDDIANELFCPIEMFNGYDYVWMGHVHKPQVLSKFPFVAHIGSMDISNFGETDQKKHIVIIDCNSTNDQFDTEYLPARPLKKICIEVPKDTIDTTEYVINQIEKINDDWKRSIIKVEISLSSPELKSVNKDNIEKYLIKNGAFNVCSILETKNIPLIKKDNKHVIDTKMDVVSAINTYAQAHVDEKMRSRFTELAIDIYNQYRSELK